MSTIKADAVTAVTTNGDLSLDGIGTGGVSINVKGISNFVNGFGYIFSLSIGDRYRR